MSCHTAAVWPGIDAKVNVFWFGLGMVGLALSYALSITNLLSGLIFTFAQTEMQLVSVERTEEYSTCIPQEPQHGKGVVSKTVIVNLYIGE